MNPARPASLAKRLATALAALAAVNLSAQTASPTAETFAEPAIIVLSPFTVDTTRDVGFVAASSLAGGRLAGELVDTPVAYSVQTREFLDALNLNSLNAALEWTVNATTTPDDGRDQMFGGTGASTIRGVGSSASQRNFFAGGSNYDTYNLDRLDYGRGPNSILFGTGTLGGTANAVTKGAALGRSFHEVRAEHASWDSRRATIDVNEKIGARAAVRVAAVWHDAQTWRDWERSQKTGVTPAFSVELTKTTQLKIVGEYYESTSRAGMLMMQDSLSGWDGVTTFTAPQAATPAASTGTTRNGTQFWVWSAASGLPFDTVMSYTGTLRTNGHVGGTGARPLGGVPSGPLGIGVNGQPFLSQIGVPAALYDVAIQNSNFRLPSRGFSGIGPTPSNIQRFRDITFFLDQRIGSSVFLQLSGGTNKAKTYGNITYFANNGFADGVIDVMQNLPDGRANPQFKKVYAETRPERVFQDTTNKALRLTATFVKETKWVNLKLNALGAIEQKDAKQRREYYVLPLDADPREWGMANTRANKIRYRYYWDQAYREVPTLPAVSVVDPATGTTQKVTPLWVNASDRADGTTQRYQEARYLQFAGHLSFWNKRLILLGAYRSDQLDRTLSLFTNAMDQPVGSLLSERDIAFRPSAPKDYYKLTYAPKTTAGAQSGATAPAIARPRDAFGVALPQYAADRFQDDFNPPEDHGKKSTQSVGTVLNLKYGLAVWANHSQTFNPGDFSKVTINYDAPTSSVSSGTDVGLRLVLLGGKFVANLSRYQSTEAGQTITAPSGFDTLYTIIQINAIGDDSTDGRNIRNVPNIPGSVNAPYADYQDRKSSGYEFELTANLTRAWRLTLNAARADATQTNAYSVTRAYVDAHDTVFRQILDDAGVLVGADNVASIDRARTPSIDASNAVTAWNRLQSSRANWVTGTQLLNRLTRYTANVFSDYRLMEGRLKGLRLGYGMQFRGPQAIGYRGADTILSPTSATTAIDDPTVDAYTVVWAKSYFLATGTLGYPLKLKGGRTVDFNLTVSNLFNYDRVLYNTTGIRPRGGDFSTVARETVPIRFSYATPRSYQLSASYKF